MYFVVQIPSPTPINQNKFKGENKVKAPTDKKTNILAVNWGSNPGAGVLIFINAHFLQEKKPYFFHKNFLSFIPP
jgi:hypothetical protein